MDRRVVCWGLATDSKAWRVSGEAGVGLRRAWIRLGRHGWRRRRIGTGKPLDGVHDAFGRKRDSTGTGAWLVFVLYKIFSPSESKTASLLLHLQRGFC